MSSSDLNRLLLFEEYRLIERSENDINGAWKGAHLLLFFLAFVFGSFCTFCFHMLMYLFDEKCVLFPKLLSITSLQQNIIYEFMPASKDIEDMPVDFLSTQWVEKSTCSLPTYVPLLSGIFGLVWTTMFLMCSTGSRTLTGLQRPWRVLPPVFLFSLAMGSLCIYSSVITHAGLEELCRKLGEITGSSTCTYTVNVVTLLYERRIRGVYQATRLTIISAWLHTACWLLSALLALVRVLLAVDFLLVRVSAELHGDVDKIMEKNEVQIRTILAETPMHVDSDSALDMNTLSRNNAFTELMEKGGDLLFLAEPRIETSSLSLLPEERNRVARIEAMRRVSKDAAFIVKWVYDLVDKLHLSEFSDKQLHERATSVTFLGESQSTIIIRQFGQENISFHFEDYKPVSKPVLSTIDSLIFHQATKKKKGIYGSEVPTTSKASTSNALTSRQVETDSSIMNLLPETRERIIDKMRRDAKKKKSIIKTVGVQTGEGGKRKLRVHILSDKSDVKIISDDEDDTSASGNITGIDKETQTKDKEKQD